MAEFTTNTVTQRFAVNDLGRLSKKKKKRSETTLR